MVDLRSMMSPNGRSIRLGPNKLLNGRVEQRDPLIREWVPGVRVERVPCGEVTLEVARAGQGDPPVVFLHGFPEAWISWRHQMTAFVAAGRTVIAPNLRGYGDSDKPRRTSDYSIAKLSADIAGLARALGHHSIDLVGHDWGGVIAFDVAARFPEL